jgi:hypothetical protein
MKKYLLIPVGLLFFVLLIYTSSGYGYSKILFVTRHLAIYGIFVSLVVIGQIYIRDYLNHKINKHQSTKVLSVTVGVLGAVLLLVIGNVQLRVLMNVTSTNYQVCDYYDENGTVLYQSYTDSCATYSINEVTDKTTTYTFIEESSIDNEDVLIFQTVTITYNEYNLVEKIEVHSDETKVIDGVSNNNVYHYLETTTTSQNGLLTIQELQNTITNEIIFRNTYHTIITDDTERKKHYETRLLTNGVYDLENYQVIIYGVIDEIRFYKGHEEYYQDDCNYSLRLTSDELFDSNQIGVYYDISGQDDLHKNIRVRNIDTYLAYYGSISYLKTGDIFINTEIDHQLSTYFDPETRIASNYSLYDLIKSDNTYTSKKKEYELTVQDGLYKVITTTLETKNGSKIYDEHLFKRTLEDRFLYESRIMNITDFEDYLIYRMNSIIDNPIAYFLEEVLYLDEENEK